MLQNNKSFWTLFSLCQIHLPLLWLGRNANPTQSGQDLCCNSCPGLHGQEGDVVAVFLGAIPALTPALFISSPDAYPLLGWMFQWGWMFWWMLIHFEALQVHQLLPGAGRVSDCSPDLHETNKQGLTIKGLHSHEESSLLSAFSKACPRQLLLIAVEKINT